MSLKNRTEYPELLKKCSKEIQKVYHILDNNIDIDFCFCKNGVVIQVKLGEKVIGKIPIAYEIENEEIIFINQDNYAEIKT